MVRWDATPLEQVCIFGALISATTILAWCLRVLLTTGGGVT